MNWLDTVKLELENFPDDQLLEPPEEVQAGEQVLGVMEPDQQRIYSLAMHWEKLAAQTELEVRYVKAGAARDDRRREASKLGIQSKLLRAVLWYTFAQQYDCPMITCRAGWKVVRTREQFAIAFSFSSGSEGE